VEAEPDENVGWQFSKNRTDLNNQKPKTQFLQFGFQKTLAVFHIISFTIHLPT